MQNETSNQQWNQEQRENPNPVEGQENAIPAVEEMKNIPEVTGIPAVEPAAEQVSPAGGEVPVKETGAVNPVKEGGFKRFLRFLFGPDTRTGRFMRPFLRILAFFVIAFAAGMLAAYFILYQPLKIQYNTAVSYSQQMNTTLQDDQTTITTLEGEITALQATMTSQQAETERANYQVCFLIAKNDVMRAKLALVDEENGPGGPTTMAALNDLEKHLADLLPYVQADDPVLADLLTSRLDVVQSELVRDSKQAKIELDSFYTNLLELEETLFE